MKHIAAVLAPALLCIPLTACGGSDTKTTETKTVTASPSSSPTSSSVSSTSSTAADDGAAPAPETSTDSSSSSDGSAPTLAFGKTFTSSTGRQVTISEPQAYTPSDTAATDSNTPAGTVYRKLSITLNNGSKESFDTSNLFLTATSGETSVDSVVDSDKGIGDSPSSTLLPGRKITWQVAYPVKVGSNLTIEVSTMAGTSAIWDGKIN